MLKTIEELDEELYKLCKYCPRTDYGGTKANTGHWNLCEGFACDKAYEKYLEDNQDEGEEE